MTTTKLTSNQHQHQHQQRSSHIDTDDTCYNTYTNDTMTGVAGMLRTNTDMWNTTNGENNSNSGSNNNNNQTTGRTLVISVWPRYVISMIIIITVSFIAMVYGDDSLAFVVSSSRHVHERSPKQTIDVTSTKTQTLNIPIDNQLPQVDPPIITIPQIPPSPYTPQRSEEDDTSSARWTRLEPRSSGDVLPSWRYGHSSVSTNGSVYITMGYFFNGKNNRPTWYTSYLFLLPLAISHDDG
jgi:hypothetical protein